MREIHPDPAELSALGEDLLSESESSALRRHLAECEECSAIAADLEALRRELAGLEDPGPMPEDIAARIDAALAAEAVSRETDGPAVSRETEWVQPRTWPWMALAAVTVLAVLGLGGVLLQSFSLPGSGAADAEAGAQMMDDADPAYEEDSAAEAGTGDDVAFRVQSLLSSLSRRDTTPSEASSSDGEEQAEGTDGGGGIQETRPMEEEEGEAGAEEPLHTAPRCVLSATGRSSETPLAVDPYFSFEGMRAYLVVLGHSGDQDLVDAYVVTAECSSGSSPQTGELLHQQTVARP
ncbi:anti-sigma factor family protein [Streptomyces aidingensis]|uniref:Zinc-finger n=1 Tax=Streptomyces aidingensis TaxID=910347 RepID=A0A1I1QJS5_9ACTN|nr:zf-HC2 domain-containing protein [Streptomyces aidingensis]SFD22232.1 hypothetical protein SAMN05421773_111140 [Streptomyces aidingensis]